MAYNTDNLNLFCYDSDLDAAEVFSIQQALNDNWVKIDNIIPTLALKSDIPTNYVTTNTAQTISGNKTFTGVTKVPESSTVGTAIALKAQSKAQNGYLRLGNGITIQWGQYMNGDAKCNANAERTNSINFPVNIGIKPWVIITSSTSVRLIASSHDYTSSGFTWIMYNPSANVYNGLYFDWIAIFTT